MAPSVGEGRNVPSLDRQTMLMTPSVSHSTHSKPVEKSHRAFLVPPVRYTLFQCLFMHDQDATSRVTAAQVASTSTAVSRRTTPWQQPPEPRPAETRPPNGPSQPRQLPRERQSTRHTSRGRRPRLAASSRGRGHRAKSVGARALLPTSGNSKLPTCNLDNDQLARNSLAAADRSEGDIRFRMS
jgi:hypothetical protein